jgi:inorganic pyrophosphatase/exopolyphosphatase
MCAADGELSQPDYKVFFSNANSVHVSQIFWVKPEFSLKRLSFVSNNVSERLGFR